MDFESAIQTFAQAWMSAKASNSSQPPLQKSKSIDIPNRPDEYLNEETLENKKSDEKSNGKEESSILESENNAIAENHEKSSSVSSSEKYSDHNSDMNLTLKKVPVFVSCTIKTSPSELKGPVDVLVEAEGSCSFKDITKVLLNQLGFNEDDIHQAKGELLLTNWNSIPLEAICSDPNKTIADIFNQLTSVPTLKITFSYGKPLSVNEMRDKFMGLVFKQQTREAKAAVAAASIHPDSVFCSSFDSRISKLGLSVDDNRFGSWYPRNFTNSGSFSQKSFESRIPTSLLESKLSGIPQLSSQNFHSNRDGFFDGFDPNRHGASGSDPLQSISGGVDLFSNSMKPRMRICFDPETELPKLQKWFKENNHPTRQQVEDYVKELNSSETRRGRKALEVNNVIYWFKNTRAAVKRSEAKSRLRSGTPLGEVSTPSPFKPYGGCLSIGQNKTESVFPKHLLSPPLHNYNWPWLDLASRANFMASNSSSSPSPVSSLATHSLLENSSRGLDGRIDPVFKDWHVAKSDGVFPRFAWPEKDFGLQESGRNYMTRERVANGTTNGKVEEGMLEVVPDTASDDEDDKSSIACSSPGRSECGTPDKKILPEETNKENVEKGELKSRVDSPKRDASSSATMSSPESSTSDKMFHSNLTVDQLKSPPNNSMIIPPALLYLNNPASMLYLSHYMNPYLQASNSPPGGLSPPGLSSYDLEKRKRNRTFIDPVSEVPRLEEWFIHNSHPSHAMIARYTDDLNSLPYRQKFPKLEQKNIQFWFKNRRAKCKRLNICMQ